MQKETKVQVFMVFQIIILLIAITFYHFFSNIFVGKIFPIALCFIGSVFHFSVKNFLSRNEETALTLSKTYNMLNIIFMACWPIWSIVKEFNWQFWLNLVIVFFATAFILYFTDEISKTKLMKI